MAPRACIVVPTRRPPRLPRRGAALDRARRPAERGAEVLVVDDGPDAATRAVAERHGARYVAHDAPRGLNAARNTAIDATDARAARLRRRRRRGRPGLARRAARARPPSLPGGRRRAHRPDPRRGSRATGCRTCGREGPPITFLDLGPADGDAERAWGANMAIRRSGARRASAGSTSALDLVRRRGGVAGAAARRAAGGSATSRRPALDHRRAGDDARLRALARAAYRRGRARAGASTPRSGAAPRSRPSCACSPAASAHGPRAAAQRRHDDRAQRSAGVRERAARPADARAAGADDFLSGAQRRRSAAAAARCARRDACARRPRGARPAARAPRPRRRRDRRRGAACSSLGVDRPEHDGRWTPPAPSCCAAATRSTSRTAPPAARGKFENLNALLAAHPPDGFDWLLVVDDDVALPRGFLDRFLFLAERLDLRARPARAPPPLARRLGGHAPPPGRRGARDDVRRDRPGDRVPPRHVRRAAAVPAAADGLGPRRALGRARARARLADRRRRRDARRPHARARSARPTRARPRSPRRARSSPTAPTCAATRSRTRGR